MSVTVVIPFGGDNPERLANLATVTDFYAVCFPDWRVRVVHAAEEPFNRARAVNRGVRSAATPMVVVNDADTICHPDALELATTLAARRHALVQAYSRYVRLNGAGVPIFEQQETENHGCVAVRRRVWLDAGGYDERFEGWGFEDLDLNRRLALLRVPGTATHLWHEPAPENPANVALFYAEGR